MANKRDAKIMEYVQRVRPDCATNTKALMNNDAILLLMILAFEAGREFQEETKMELGNPSLY